MKLPDEFIDELAMKAWPNDEWIGVQYIKFARAVEQAAYKLGQEEMRERAAQEMALRFPDDGYFLYIRALPTE